jgi:hypothetical protein
MSESYFVRELPPHGRRKIPICILMCRHRRSGLEEEERVADFKTREKAIDFQRFLDGVQAQAPAPTPDKKPKSKEGQSIPRPPVEGSAGAAPEVFTRRGDIDTTVGLEYGGMASGTKRYRHKPPIPPGYERPKVSGLAKKKNLGQAEKRLAKEAQSQVVLEMMKKMSGMMEQPSATPKPVQEQPVPQPPVEKEPEPLSGGEFLPSLESQDPHSRQGGTVPSKTQDAQQPLPTQLDSPPELNDE